MSSKEYATAPWPPPAGPSLGGSNLEWLEALGFLTRICEHHFDATVRRSGDEPYIALCGFDSALARRSLEGAGFALVVECGLRGSVDTFDQLSLHTFPDGTRTPVQIWAEDVTPIAKAKPALLDAFRTQAPCGILAETLAHKALSSSFVGAFAGALVIAEPKSCAADTVVSAARSSTDNCEATPLTCGTSGGELSTPSRNLRLHVRVATSVLFEAVSEN